MLNMEIIYFSERSILVNELIPVFQEYYSLISNGKEKVRLQYRSHLAEGNFAEALLNSVDKDRFLEYTTIGIHKDDLLLEMDGFSGEITWFTGTTEIIPCCP